MSRLPDWLHPWRWYAATAIVEALYRQLILRESVCAIGIRFGRRDATNGWRSLRRWRKQLLVSPTLWGWLGSRLGIRKAAASRSDGQLYLTRLLGEMRIAWDSSAKVFDQLAVAVRGSLSGLVHNRREAWPVTQFRPGNASRRDSGATPTVLPTEEDPVRGPPR
jgi:hypothetical protein